MGKRKIFFSVTLLVITVALSAQSRISPKKVEEDVNFFIETVENVHPDMYYYISKDSFEIIKNSIYKEISTPKTKDEFLDILHNFRPCFDSHTNFGWIITKDRKYVKSGGLFFNKGIKITNDKLWLLKKDGSIAGEIHAINGMSAQHIILSGRKYFHYESAALTDLEVKCNFQDLLYYLGVHSPFNVSISKSNNERTTLQIDGGNWGAARYANNYHRHYFYGSILEKDSIALLEYNSCDFYGGLLKEFTQFADTFFHSLAQSNVRHLFIDISNNMGGRSGVNNLIFKHLLADTLTVKSMGFLKNSKELSKSNYAHRYNEENIGRIDSIDYEWIVSPGCKDKYYAYNVYLITGPKSFSAAGDFVDTFIRNNLGIVVGQETGAQRSDICSPIVFKLPNSKLQFSVSAIHWNYNTPKGGFEPDLPFEINYMKRLDLTDLISLVKLIRKGYSFTIKQ
ncbi:hypothetical protein EYV94_04710 [Puteibacter caeruleilacunae]|nr:hypothetical protein EYV94_04710 [Puteibacter caeruleilacunae]